MLPISLAVALASVSTANSRSPPKFAKGQNNVAGSMPNPRGNPQAGVLLVGTFGSARQCEAAATADPRAASWTYHECGFPPAGSGNYSCHCYARTSSYWHPMKQELVDSGYIRPGTPVPSPPPPPPALPTGPCKDNEDCQLNGACTRGRCECDPAWTGSRCQRLNLLPGSINAGLQDARLSSWGGSVLQNTTDGTWHMYAAVIEHECGLAAWRPNSALGHATASSPEGPYTFKRFIKPHFAHEPVALMGSDGMIMIWHIGAGENDTGSGSNYAANCSHCTGSDHKWTGGGTFYGPTSILYSKSFEGPWETVNAGFGSKINGCPECGDTNPAPLIKQDGSIEMMWRTTEMDPKPTACPAASCMGLATAPSWRGPYQWSRANIFANQSAATNTHIEDAHVWLAPKGSTNPGSYHAIFHSDVEKNSGGAAGGHAWSSDGATWTFSPWNAFNHTVLLENGSSITLRQRERPHLGFDPKTGNPIVLTNGAGWENDCDHVFTFAQPIANA